MNRISLMAGVSVVLGGLLLLIPWCLLPVCGVGPGLSLSPGHHGCHVALWGATGSGVVLLVLGGAAVGLRRRGVTFALLAGATLAGLVTLLSSTVFPGMCRLATMACRRGTQPALVLVGVALVLFGGVGLWRVARRS